MKILSIDLDYISGPAIIHNEQILHRKELDMWPVRKWVELFDTHPGEFSHKIDVSNYQFCLRTYLRAISNCHDVRFGYDHDNILYGLEGHTDIEVINIDHHDDIFSGCFGSDDEEIDALVTYDRVMEGNWGFWLKITDRLKSFTWIGNRDSDNITTIPTIEKHFDNFEFYSKEEYEFEDYNFDQIFVCLSPGYIPPLHWHMLGTFITVYEELTGNKIELSTLHRKYEMEKYYEGVTKYITGNTKS